jgi:hypothetical protein
MSRSNSGVEESVRSGSGCEADHGNRSIDDFLNVYRSRRNSQEESVYIAVAIETDNRYDHVVYFESWNL